MWVSLVIEDFMRGTIKVRVHKPMPIRRVLNILAATTSMNRGYETFTTFASVEINHQKWWVNKVSLTTHYLTTEKFISVRWRSFAIEHTQNWQNTCTNNGRHNQFGWVIENGRVTCVNVVGFCDWRVSIFFCQSSKGRPFASHHTQHTSTFKGFHGY